jgi:hypothetical protein
MSDLFPEQYTNSDTQFPTDSVYTDRSVWVGSYLGGPLVAGYIIAHNFKAFNEPSNAKKTWIITIIITLLIFGGLFLTPQAEKIPGVIIPLTYTVIAYFLIRYYQGKKIEDHINAGGPTYGWLRVVGVSIIGLMITVIPIFGIAYFTTPDVRPPSTAISQESYPAPEAQVLETPTIKRYGTVKSELGFVKSNISEGEVDKLAEALTKIGFLNEPPQKSLYVKKIGSDYEVSISCNNKVKITPEVIAPIVQIRKNMQKSFPDNKIVFNLIVDRLDNVVKRIE